MLRVGLHENVFILFLMAIKTAGLAQNVRVGQVSGNAAIFYLHLIVITTKLSTKMSWSSMNAYGKNSYRERQG